MKRRDFLKGLAALVPVGAVGSEVAFSVGKSLGVITPPVVTHTTYGLGVTVTDLSTLLDARYRELFFEQYDKLPVRFPFLKDTNEWRLTSGSSSEE